MRAKRSGFSRWELLALGAVVSMASLVLLPALAQTADEQRAAENANASRCMKNLKQIALGLLQYQQDYDDRMPQAALGKAGGAPENWRVAYGWADAVFPYLKSRAFFDCPSDKHQGQNDPMKPSYSDYWLNKNAAGVRFGDIRSPASLIVLGDGDGGAPNSNARYNLNKLPQSWGYTLNSPAIRHDGKGIYAFADGHAKMCSSEALLPNRPTFDLR